MMEYYTPHEISSGVNSYTAHDIGKPYIWHMDFIIMRQCVAYIHVPNTTLTFELNVKFIGFLTVLRVLATAF